MTKETKTQYVNVEGTIEWAKLYEPDEFRGSIRWGVNFFPKDEKNKKKLADVLNPKKEWKEKDGKEFVTLYRHKLKFMKTRMVEFNPPIIYDENGDALVKYVDDKTDELVRSFDVGTKTIKRVGDPILIGNGSSVLITLCVYPTAMGPGNRLESIKILDLITYERPENTPETKESKTPEVEQEENATPPW